MLARKKEEGTKRRKRRDIDIINDNDDIIDQLIQNMRGAAEVMRLRNDFMVAKILIQYLYNLAVYRTIVN